MGLAHSNVTLAPTERSERIRTLDVARGVSLLGILLMNIPGFGLPFAYSDPTIYGGATGWNLQVWWINNMFFEGTMRGIFSMLFGAGVCLFLGRDSSIQVVNTFFKRLMWLFIFGLVHAYLLLWEGEILYPYALVGFFAFNFRNWKPKYLITAAVFLVLCGVAQSLKDHILLKRSHDKAMLVEAKKKKGVVLSKVDSITMTTWEEKLKDKKPDSIKINEEIEARQKGYFSVLWHKSSTVQFMQSYVMYRYFFWDVLAMMLFGMAFLKNGILKGEKSKRFYVIWTLIGYVIGITVNYFETKNIIENNFSVLSFSFSDLSYDLGRVFTTFGHIGLIMLFVKSGMLTFLRKSLEAVGTMAFSNYIMQTLICITIFMGFGFGMFGKLQRYELYFIVIGIWIFQLIASPIWLKYFRFGPLEWAWRSLTYWKKQPFRK
jgi:uncharacterized protein